MVEQQARATEIITREIETLRQHVRRSFGNYIRMAFKLSEEEAKNLEAQAQEAEGKDETAVQVEADSQAEQPARDEEQQTKLPS